MDWKFVLIILRDWFRGILTVLDDGLAICACPLPGTALECN